LWCMQKLIVYFQRKPEFEFLRERKFRIRTVRLRVRFHKDCFPLSIIEINLDT